MLKYLNNFISFLKVIVNQRYLIYQLAKRDFQNRYLASYIGLPWAFIQPSVVIFVWWFIFSYGFRVGVTDGEIPFILWLICGAIPWFFLNESIQGSTQSLLEYSYLIKKVFFRASIIPLIKILTALVIHFFLLFVVIVFILFYGYKPGLYWIQIPYYLFASIMLVLGIGWLTSSVTVFVRDMSQLVSVIMQLMFWGTPILWNYNIMISGRFHYIVYLNPFFYITNGYRDAFLNQGWFFEKSLLTAYFWGITSIVFILGAMVFNQLKPHFADVL